MPSCAHNGGTLRRDIGYPVRARRALSAAQLKFIISGACLQTGSGYKTPERK